MSLPSGWHLIRVFGQFLLINGQPAVGTISFRSDQQVIIGGVEVVPYVQTVTLDATGSFEIHLAATDDPNIAPTGWAYQATFDFSAGTPPDPFYFPVAWDGGDLNLVNARHVAPPVPTVSYLTTADIGAVVASQGSVVAAEADAQAALAECATQAQEIASLQAAQVTGYLGYTTRAALYADLAHPANTLALVTNDQTADYNATYIKLGATNSGSWQIATDRISSVDTRLKTVETNTVPGVAYALDSYTVVQPGTSNVVIPVSNPNTHPFDLPFVGWGERYTPAGVSFNAINLPKIAQIAALSTSQWKQLFIVIRTGANSQNASAPIVAVGSAYVTQGQTPLTNVLFQLLDPVSGVPITLTDGSFSGGEYFIGVYAKNVNGDWASCGTPTGTLSNSMGRSYYFLNSGTDPTTQGWTVSSVNDRCGFQHVYITGPHPGLAFKPSTGLKTDLGYDARLQIVEPKLAFAVNASTVVTASATVVEVDVTLVGTKAQDLPFNGWGYRFAPAGVSFNALRIKSISRTTTTDEARKWAQLKIMVRAAASNSHTGGTVVAVGYAWVSREADALTDVTFILYDPTTGAPKTLTNADLQTEYFIGVVAVDTQGNQASCGEFRGTTSNQTVIAQSYYSASPISDPNLASWTAASSGANFPQGVQHLLLTNPVASITYSAAQALINAMPVQMPAPEVDTPAYVFGVQGRECNLYFENICLGDWKNYYVNVDTGVSLGGQQQNERWTWTPGGAVTTGDLTIQFVDKRTGTVLTTNTIHQRAAASSAGTGLTKKVIAVGDSLIAAGTITQTLLDISAGDAMHATMLGTQGTGPNNHEGRGGWMISDYTTAGRTFYAFTVSGISTPPVINSTTYTNNGQTFTVQSVALTGSQPNISGTIVCSATGAPSASGTLTKSNAGVGDAAIAFSASSAQPGNPFWIGGTLNFAQYLTNNSIAVPDWVFIALGINDVFGQTTDAGATSTAQSAFTALDGLIASIKAADANVRVGIVIPSPPSYDQDAFGLNYATGQSRWRFKRNILIWARELVSKYAGQEASRIYVVPSNTALDTVNNMQIAATPTPVNSRSTVNIVRQSNGVHPAASGYQQIADAWWAFMKFYP